MRNRFAGGFLAVAMLLSAFVVAPGAVAQADTGEQPASGGASATGLVINEAYTSGGSAPSSIQQQIRRTPTTRATMRSP
jgi:hypothetical protein